MSKQVIDPSSISNLSSADKILFSRFSFGPKETPNFHCVHHAFESHAASIPNAPAVEHLDETITYAELDRQANGVATILRETYNVGPGSRVVLLVERSILMVVGILAILKAGGAYVPLDGVIVTQSTLEHVLKDSGCAVVVTLKRFAHRITNLPTVQLESTVPNPGVVCAKPEDLSTPTDTAYIIYTSGTTGKPKGVEVMHGNVTNLVCLKPGNVGMAPGMRVSQLLNIAFDMAAWEILGSMSNGCTLCIRGKSSKEWKAVMKTVDIVIATPSMMGPHNPADYPNIKFVATAGEVCPKVLADNWAKTANFYNSCGPTEITIVNTLHLHKSGENLTIGAPSPNNNVYVLDEDMKPVAIGQTGVMWAGGAGISRGYINLPEKTAERYKLDPFVNDGSMMFNTGDLGRWTPEGELEHFGRTDDQVKIKGFRVELDGVGAAMETHPDVKVATALLINDELWGFVTPMNVNVLEIKEATAKVQPYYAVPTKWYTMEEFPHTSNGKIDKRALKQLVSGEQNTAAPEKPATPSPKTTNPPPSPKPKDSPTKTVGPASSPRIPSLSIKIPTPTNSSFLTAGNALSGSNTATYTEESRRSIQITPVNTRFHEGRFSKPKPLPTFLTSLLILTNVLLLLSVLQNGSSSLSKAGSWLFNSATGLVSAQATPPTHDSKLSGSVANSASGYSPMFWIFIGMTTPFLLKLLWRGALVTFKDELDLMSRQKSSLRLLCSGRSVREVLGDKLAEPFLSTDSSSFLYDSSAQSKPDMSKLTSSATNDAVLVVSNESLTRKIVYDMMSKGVVALGGI